MAPSYGAHPHSHAHSQKPHGSDYGPPSCVKNATLHTYCLEDYEYPSEEIQVENQIHANLANRVTHLTCLVVTRCIPLILGGLVAFIYSLGYKTLDLGQIA